MSNSPCAILQGGIPLITGDEDSIRCLFKNLTQPNDFQDRAKYMDNMRHLWSLDLDQPIALQTPDGVGDPLALELGDHVRCPPEPRWEGDIAGCGSYHVTKAEDEPGTYDCDRCGIFFNLEATKPCPSEAEYERETPLLTLGQIKELSAPAPEIIEQLQSQKGRSVRAEQPSDYSMCFQVCRYRAVKDIRDALELRFKHSGLFVLTETEILLYHNGLAKELLQRIKGFAEGLEFAAYGEDD